VVAASEAHFSSQLRKHCRAFFSTTHIFAMAFFWDDDPLVGLPEIALHPGRSGSQSSAALSSLPPSPIIQQNAVEVVSNVLSDNQPIHASDDTAKVLRAFVDHLSGQGLSTLQSEIYNFAENPHQLRQLRNFLTDAILKPSMFILYPIRPLTVY